MIAQWLRRPYPFNASVRLHFKHGIWGGLFVAAFLFIFKPFGMGTANVSEFQLFLICLQFGVITTATFTAFFLMVPVFPQFFRERDWTIGKEILINISVIFLIGVANMLFAFQYFGNELSWKLFWYTQRITLAVGIFPVVFSAYTKQRLLDNRFKSGALCLNEKIQHHPPEQKNERTKIKLLGDNLNDQLDVFPDELILLESADNYVKVFYLDASGNVQNQLLRSTLKKMDQQLEAFPNLFRCHRTYLANLSMVNQVSGNAQGYKLHLDKLDSIIPVARNRKKAIEQLLVELGEY